MSISLILRFSKITWDITLIWNRFPIITENELSVTGEHSRTVRGLIKGTGYMIPHST